MTKEEALKLMELIVIAYPYAYKDQDKQHRIATVRMWAASFPRVPYGIIEQCFNRYRMESRYPPTVADINQELYTLRTEAETAMEIHRQLGNPDQAERYRQIMESASGTGEGLCLPMNPHPPARLGDGRW